MKKFDELTNLQKEYFYASGTVASLIALALIVPPIAVFAYAVAGFGLIAIASVAIINRTPKTVKVETEK